MAPRFIRHAKGIMVKKSQKTERTLAIVSFPVQWQSPFMRLMRGATPMTGRTIFK
jgi:hypothetical protein